MLARSPQPLRAALLPLLLLVGLLAGSGTAHAASCAPTLADGEEVSWILNVRGAIDDAGSDTYDGGNADIALSVDGGAPVPYPAAAANTCTVEDAGRETRYPTVTVGAASVSRTAYVAPDAPFARILTLVTNTSAQAIDVAADLTINLGSDSSTQVFDTSSGDAVLGAGDRWFTSEQSDRADDASAIIFDGAGASTRLGTIPGKPIVDGQGNGGVRHVVTIPAGRTAALMTVFHSSGDRVLSNEFARVNGNGTDAMYSGLSAQERGALRNWPATPDSDGDGRFNDADNCPAVPSGDQGDNDRDGLGDICDADDDADGLADAAETALGLDPRSADSDGDGTRDGSDRCPTVPAAGGCPTASAPAPVGSAAAQAVTRSGPVSALASGGLSVKPTLKKRGKRVLIGVTGRLSVPAGRACGGSVEIHVIRGEKVRATLSAAVKADCSFAASGGATAKSLGKRPLVVAAYSGSDGVLGRVAAPVRARLS